MILAREAGDEQSRDFISHQFINERIRPHENVDRGFIESIHQLAELSIVHRFGNRSRAAHVHEQHGQLDLCAAGELACKKMTGCAISRILNRAQSNISAYKMHQPAAKSSEGRMAIYTAWIRWEHSEDVTPLFRSDVAFSEVLMPHLVNSVDLVSPSKFFGQGFI